MKNFWIVFVFANCCVNGQNVHDKLWNVKINGTQLVDGANFPTVQFSIERKILPAISLLVEGGPQLYDVNGKPDTLYYKSKGFKANVELRGYLLQLFKAAWFTKPGGLFLGIQPFYRQNRFTTTIFYVKSDPQDTVNGRYSDVFGVKRKVFGMNLTAGYQHHFSRRFIMEPSIAVGRLRRNVSNIERNFDLRVDESTFSHDIFGQESHNLSESTDWFYNFTINFRIGYTF